MLPRLTEKLSGWDPLADPAEGTADFAVWRPLLESESQRDAIFQVPPHWYRRLPALGQVAQLTTNRWDAHRCMQAGVSF